MTLNSFPAQIRDFQNLKGTWHQMLARSRKLQSIFGLLTHLLLVQIGSKSVVVFQNHCVQISWVADQKLGEMALGEL